MEHANVDAIGGKLDSDSTSPSATTFNSTYMWPQYGIAAFSQANDPQVCATKQLWVSTGMRRELSHVV